MDDREEVERDEGDGGEGRGGGTFNSYLGAAFHLPLGPSATKASSSPVQL